MIIEIKGVEFENKGAHLMLVTVIQQLKGLWPEARIALSHSAKASSAQRSTVASLRKIALRKHLMDLNRLSYWLPVAVRRKLLCWGLVTEADIDVLVDASGFSYSDQWPSKVRIFHLKGELLRFYRYKKPYIFMPQAFGPAPSARAIIIATHPRKRNAYHTVCLPCRRRSAQCSPCPFARDKGAN